MVPPFGPPERRALQEFVADVRARTPIQQDGRQSYTHAMISRDHLVQTRDFTYVANVVDGVLKACHAPAARGEVINVATAERISLNQLFAAVKAVTGATVDPIYMEPRVGDVRDSLADLTKARQLLAYAPIVPFEEGLRRTIAWYREQSPV